MEATKEVALREANQNFARLIREVEAGQEVIITRRGEAVAKLVPMPAKKRVLTPEQEAACRRMRERVRRHSFTSTNWQMSRDELYDDVIDD